MTTQNVSRKFFAALAAKCAGTIADSGESFLTLEGRVFQGGKEHLLRLKLETLAPESDDLKVEMVLTSAPPSLAHREVTGAIPKPCKVSLFSDDGAAAIQKKANLFWERIQPSALADYHAFALMNADGGATYKAESEATAAALVGVTMIDGTGTVLSDGNPVPVKVLGSTVQLLGLRVSPARANALIAALRADLDNADEVTEAEPLADAE